MFKRMAVMVLGLGMAFIFAMTAQAQQTTPPAGNSPGSGEAAQLRQDIQSLRQQAAPIRTQLQQLEAQVKPLREQLRAIHEKIQADREKLEQLRAEHKENRGEQRHHQQGQGGVTQPPVQSQDK